MDMNKNALKETFYGLVAPDLPNEWDVDEAMESLAGADEEKCRSVLNMVPVIWPVSHSLCFDYLKMAVPALECIKQSSLAQWVNRTLDQYEKKGLLAAHRFMADVETNFLCPLQGESGLRFEQAAGRLLPYLRGLSGRPLELAAAPAVFTDTATIFLPPEMTFFPAEEDDFFLYKLIVSYQWAFIAGDSYTVVPEAGTSQAGVEDASALWLQDFLQTFADPRLAGDIYHLLETIRLSAFLHRELPGMMRRKKALLPGGAERPGNDAGAVLILLQRLAMDKSPGPFSSPEAAACWDIAAAHKKNAAAPGDSVKAAHEMYEILAGLGEYDAPVEPLLFQGVMRLDNVRQARKQRLEELQDRFIDGLASRLLSMPQKAPAAKKEAGESDRADVSGEQPDIAVIMQGGGQGEAEQAEQSVLITINNEEIDLGDDLQETAAEIIRDIGYLPKQYVSSAAGRAGSGYAGRQISSMAAGFELASPIIYDEWDYRRKDFRKNWCSVLEKEIPLVHTDFVSATLQKYHGQVCRLRYQFEMMRSTERLVRRQKDGEDIDFDALIESLNDSRAGLAPSDRLYIRLKRDERDISVLFLVDMSNSTQGWVGRTIKETLVLMCEALEKVGDRYGIYGFSGMRRLRSEFFHVKHLKESYDDTVRQRIGSIAPSEYTRMGPAIRHAASLLRDNDSRVRLLITLSDGKPEDYDDYKGEYAIEDTRHALIEAKAAGIFPFCITIDRHAHEYIDHMYGEVNYMMVDDVRKLPRRMPEIYRMLTR